MSFLDRIKRLFGGTASNGAGSEAPMISCHEALIFLQEFLDGELPGATRDQVRAHFDVCAHCYPKLRFEESFRAALHRVRRGEVAPPELKARVIHLISEVGEE